MRSGHQGSIRVVAAAASKGLRSEIERILQAANEAGDAVRRDRGREVPLGKKAARTRFALLVAAYEVFSERGYQSTAVGDVAERAGVSLGTYYQYFTDRSDIMATLVAAGASEILRGTPERWDPSRGRLGLRRMIAHFVQGYVASAPFQRVWEEVRHVEPELAPVHRDLTRALTRAVEESLREAQAAELVRADLDAAETARALTAMADRYCYLAFVFDPPEAGAPSADDAIDLLTTLWANAIGLVEPIAAGGKARR
jgi:AcrR family transcriptional regulator